MRRAYLGQNPRGMLPGLDSSPAAMNGKQTASPGERRTLGEHKLNRTFSNPDNLLSAAKSPYTVQSPASSPPKAQTPSPQSVTLSPSYHHSRHKGGEKHDVMKRSTSISAATPPPRELRHVTSDFPASASSMSIDVPKRPSPIPIPHTQRLLEGWLFKMGRRSFGKGYLHKRYFCLEGRVLSYWKHKPSGKQVRAKILVAPFALLCFADCVASLHSQLHCSQRPSICVFLARRLHHSFLLECGPVILRRGLRLFARK
jgi:hypothetical protein